jgi:transcriptional regulator with XRE-family HTH domain
MVVPDFSAILAGLTQSMTQADIARRLHVDPSTVCRVINGEIRSPSFATGSRILSLQAKSLKVLVNTGNDFECK